MQVAAFDYARDRVTKAGSLAKIATLIKAARIEAQQSQTACLLFDNGDTWQGSPLVDLIADGKVQSENPLIACLNSLKYDACGLGNHDLDYGIAYLESCLATLEVPVVCTNMIGTVLPKVARSALVERQLVTDAGDEISFKLGIVSSIPPKTMLWNRHHLQDRIRITDPLEALEAEAAKLRTEGADLVLALAHMGIAISDEGEEAQNQIVDVASLPGIDVIIGGHTHLRFPGPDHDGVAQADCVAGLVCGKPTVMPGYGGSDLGVIDLKLARDEDGRWQILGSDVELRPVARGTTEDQEIIAITADAHGETRRLLASPVAHLDRDINSFFSLAHPSPVSALIGAAKRKAILRAIAGSPCEKLPLLSTATAHLSGGFSGPENFLDLSAGPIHMRHLTGMNPYSNNIWAVQTKGAELLDWLEWSAQIFNTLRQDDPDQLLVDATVPGFRFDAIYGLEYQIDPSCPPLFDSNGRKIAGRSGRIRHVRWNGAPLCPDMSFLVATTDHRASGGGGYKTFSRADIVAQGHRPVQTTVLEYIQNGDFEAACEASTWSFAPGLQLQAIYLTAPEAIHSLGDIDHLRPEVCGETEDGFLRLRLHL